MKYRFTGQCFNKSMFKFNNTINTQASFAKMMNKAFHFNMISLISKISPTCNSLLQISSINKSSVSSSANLILNTKLTMLQLLLISQSFPLMSLVKLLETCRIGK